MKLVIKILIGVAAVSVAALSYFLYLFYQESVYLTNALRTAPARAKRWDKEPEPEPVKQEVDQTLKVQSPQNENLETNEKRD